MRVVPNIYKALNLETKFESKMRGAFESFGGFGMHEIVIDTPRHVSIFEFENGEYPKPYFKDGFKKSEFEGFGNGDHGGD